MTRAKGMVRGPDRPIGIFDSGIGGLTVVQAVAAALPRETLIYLGDTARYPYGTKSADVVRRFSVENAQFLVDKDIKLLVVACNTASATALDVLRERFEIPVIGVIEPGASAAVRVSRKRKIGVIATEATIRSGCYTRALRAAVPQVEVYTRACPLFVPLAEEGWVDNDIAERVARLYLATLRRSGIDALVLGCTHYPLLREVIGAVMGPEVTLVDSALATAQAVRAALRRARLARTRGRGGASFYVTDAPDRFVKVGARFLGTQVESAVQIER